MRRQSGNVARHQMLAVGMSTGSIQHRLRIGELVPRYHGVYCQSPPRDDPQALIAAAVLAGGPYAVASHGSAAWLWGFISRYEPPPEISLTQGDRRPRHIPAHRCPSLERRDISHQRGVPTTSAARTVLDLAPRLARKTLTRLVQDQRHEGHLHLPALADVLERNPFHPGTKLLKRFVENPRNPTRSPLEDDLLPFLVKYGLPLPQTNVYLYGREIDAYYPEYKLILELDGRDSHDGEDAFEDDRDRDAEHLKHGLSTVRMTTKRIRGTPDYEAERLWEIIDELSRHGAPP